MTSGDMVEQRDSTAKPVVFVYRQPIYFDDLDALQLLHNARYAVYVERATTAFYESLGRFWEQDVADNPDQFHVVREFHVEFLAPFRGTGALQVTLWLDHLGGASCTYGFRCTSAAATSMAGSGAVATPEVASVVHAQGRRTIVRLDPLTLRPTPWTEWFRAAHTRLTHGASAAS